jgi:flagellar biogenesis protein FliO
MDPFYSTMLLALGMAIVLVPLAIWLLPKLDRAAGRLSDYLDARKAR